MLATMFLWTQGTLFKIYILKTDEVNVYLDIVSLEAYIF